MCLPCKYKYKFKWPSFLRKSKPAPLISTDYFTEDVHLVPTTLTSNYMICDV